MHNAIKLLKYFMPNTYDHMQRVNSLINLLTNDEDCLLAGLVHDIGKCSTPINLMCSPNVRLSDAEYTFIKDHVNLSVKILTDLEVDPIVINIVQNHHENLDGTGYPKKLSGMQIDINARILRICDSFDAIVTRQYANKFNTIEFAFKELSNPKIYDHGLVEEFRTNYNKFYKQEDLVNFENDTQRHLEIINQINVKIGKLNE